MKSKEEVRQEELELLIKAKQGDMSAKEEIVKRHMAMSTKMVYTMTGEYDEDLISIGYYGILKAIDRYRIDSNSKFSTVAHYSIKSEISREFTNRSRAKRKLDWDTNNLSLDGVVLGGNDSDGQDTLIYETIACDNGEEWGYGRVFGDHTNSLYHAVQKLEEEQLKLFKLKYVQKLKVEEIAKELGIGVYHAQQKIRMTRSDLAMIMGKKHKCTNEFKYRYVRFQHLHEPKPKETENKH